MSNSVRYPERTVVRLSGVDAHRFLQDLVTNDLGRVTNGAVYSALLTPQGKYLFDFFVLELGGDLHVDVAADRADALTRRLGLYRLRAQVTIEITPLAVAEVWGGAAPEGEGVFADPRAPALGWRVYDPDPPARFGPPTEASEALRDALRVAHGIPESGIELRPDETFILEAEFERLNGVDFRKGCYVGQEIVARMKHKTELRKGLARVSVEGPPPPPGTEIRADGKPAGTLFTVAEGVGLAHLRFDRAGGEMQAGEATLRRI
ncbi:MAG: folate-binding protein [Pseudomonadota bacterium]